MGPPREPAHEVSRVKDTIPTITRARELATESHAKATAALDQANGETDDLRRVADYIFTRDE